MLIIHIFIFLYLFLFFGGFIAFILYEYFTFRKKQSAESVLNPQEYVPVDSSNTNNANDINKIINLLNYDYGINPITYSYQLCSVNYPLGSSTTIYGYKIDSFKKFSIQVSEGILLSSGDGVNFPFTSDAMVVKLPDEKIFENNYFMYSSTGVLYFKPTLKNKTLKYLSFSVSLKNGIIENYSSEQYQISLLLLNDKLLTKTNVLRYKINQNYVKVSKIFSNAPTFEIDLTLNLENYDISNFAYVYPVVYISPYNLSLSGDNDLNKFSFQITNLSIDYIIL